MTEKKTYAQIKAEKAAKRAAKGKEPVKTVSEISQDHADSMEGIRQRKLDRIAEKARKKQEKARAKQGLR